MLKIRNKIPLSQLHAHPQNPRKQLTVDDLSESIKESGQLVSILVRRIGNEKFEIISGHRRKAALESIGETHAECDVIEMTDEQAFQALMVTNIQAQTLSEIEEADGIKHMMDSYEWTQERAAKEFGKSQNWINMRLGLLQLTEPVKEMIIARAINTSQARYINNLPEEKQEEVATRVVEEKLSSRETAELVKEINNPAEVTRFVPITDEATQKNEIRTLGTHHQFEDQLGIEVENVVSDIKSDSQTNRQIGDQLSVIDNKPSIYADKVAVSDYIYKLYKFINQTDVRTIDIIVELGEANHALAALDKLSENITWLRNKIVSSTQDANGNVVEFRKKVDL